jgi:hypothetical protein
MLESESNAVRNRGIRDVNYHPIVSSIEAYQASEARVSSELLIPNVFKSVPFELYKFW